MSINDVKTIYKTGSMLLLKNNRDEDYVYFYDNYFSFHTAMRTMKRDENSNKDIHLAVIEEPKVIHVYFYLYHFMQLVEGEDLHLEKYDMFDPKYREKYLKVLKKTANKIQSNNKKWYHIYIAYCFYQNGKYELYDDQLAKAQKIHDDLLIEDMDKQEILNWLDSLNIDVEDK